MYTINRNALCAVFVGMATLTTLPANLYAAERHERGGENAAAEMQREPRGYTRYERPAAADRRPQTLDREYFGHNFQARRSYRIGPYHAPEGYVYRRWGYGEFLPAVFWADPFLLTDFWIFGLDIPPVGYEWVRYGPDAILVQVGSGEIGQVVYGNFL